MFALIDGNNFYASCERVFKPQLKNRPIIVLSNNDGCVIARSNEAKSLGIGMGEPYFKCKKIIKANNVKVFSANFPLYGDLSNRFMKSLYKFSPEVEVYSIDEAFFTLDHVRGSIENYARNVSSSLRRWIGIPNAIGIGPTKTLAKLANKIAKREGRCRGVLNISDHPDKDKFLRNFPVEDIWGIGHQYSQMLYSSGIKTAYNILNANLEWIKNRMGINGVRTALELRGKQCFDLEENQPVQKNIMTSRTFHKEIEDYEILEKYISRYATQCCEKLREQRALTSRVTVFIRTNRFKREHHYSRDFSTSLENSTAYTPDILEAANKALKAIYKPAKYKQAGVMLGNIQEVSVEQFNLFSNYNDKKRTVMQVLDKINDKWGKDTIHPAATTGSTLWGTARKNISRRYTTSWKELLKVKI